MRTQGVVMEIEDCAFPLVTSAHSRLSSCRSDADPIPLPGVLATTDVKEAFLNVDVALLIGSFPRKVGMERKVLDRARPPFIFVFWFFLVLIRLG